METLYLCSQRAWDTLASSFHDLKSTLGATSSRKLLLISSLGLSLHLSSWCPLLLTVRIHVQCLTHTWVSHETPRGRAESLTPGLAPGTQ